MQNHLPTVVRLRLVCKVITYSVVGDHYGADSSTNSFSERPEIQLVHRSVVQIGGNTRLGKVIHSVHLLLVSDQMLDSCNNPDTLYSVNCQGSAKCLEDGI